MRVARLVANLAPRATKRELGCLCVCQIANEETNGFPPSCPKLTEVSFDEFDLVWEIEQDLAKPFKQEQTRGNRILQDDFGAGSNASPEDSPGGFCGFISGSNNFLKAFPETRLTFREGRSSNLRISISCNTEGGARNSKHDPGSF